MVLNSKPRTNLPAGAPAVTPNMPNTQTTNLATSPATGSGTAPAYSGGAPASWGSRGGTSRPSAPSSPYDGMDSAPAPTRRNSFLTDGDYVLRIVSAEYKTGREKTFVIVEADVIASSFDQTDPTTHSAKREGERVSIFIARGDSFLLNIKELIIAASGFDTEGNPRPLDSAVSKQEAESLTNEQQAFTGAYIYTEARTKPQVRDPNKTFTYLNHWPAPLKVENGQTFVDQEKLAHVKNLG